MPSVGAYIPCYNNESTIRQAIESIKQQKVLVDELLVVDDCSTNQSASIVESMGVSLIKLDKHMGRGAARARAMKELSQDFVLSLDANKVLATDFLERAQEYLKDEKTIATFGRIVEPPPKTVTDRWRARHLMKMDDAHSLDRHALLITAGALVRREAVLSAGNYDDHFRHSEDQELGRRLLSLGYEVIFGPNLFVMSLISSNLNETMERYWRWHAGADQNVNFISYLRQISYSLKVMAADDVRAGDFLSVPISLFSPHYQFWRSIIAWIE